MASELFSVTGKPNVSNWNLEKGYSDRLGEKLSQEFYPRRILSTGPLNALTVLLKLDSADVDYLCQGPVQGLLYNFVHI